ncbi:MAG: hypothetical protein ACLFNJ_05860 [Bacteroidales bacterium]
MGQTEKNIERLIEIRDIAVDLKDDDISEAELLNYCREAMELAEKSEILDNKKNNILNTLMKNEIRSFKTLINSDMSKEARIDSLIFFCVSIITIIHGKLDI